MGIIKELDISVANAIAAGEVVERPASAVKELCENSLDAGATRINVEIKKGGVGLIRVTDDGCGMAPEDVAVSLKRNATSKISTKQDLNAITTFGFRGEALAAIAAVSRLRIITKQKNNKGIILSSRAGQVLSIEETGASDGTTIMVEELFANVPARLKFLKRDSTEASYVTSVCERIALANPNVAVTLISDGEVKFSTSGCHDLKDVVYAILGRDFANNMIKLSYNEQGIEISGFLGAPISARGNRGGQLFFVNGRSIKSTMFQSALGEACVSYIPRDRFPCCVLFVNIHPAFVDVNVHPTKAEVRFSNERAVYDAVYAAAKSAVQTYQRHPELDERILTEGKYKTSNMFLSIDKDRPTTQERQISSPELTQPLRLSSPSFNEVGRFLKQQDELLYGRYDKAEEESKKTDEDVEVPFPEAEERKPKPMPAAQKPQPTPTAPNEEKKQHESLEQSLSESERSSRTIQHKYIGELFDTYLIVQRGDDAYIIDKHAAHERIIFERLLEQSRGRDICNQILMIPIDITLDSVSLAYSDEYGEEIKSLGFNYTRTGNNISVTEIPTGFSTEAARTLFEELCYDIGRGCTAGESSKRIIFERALYQSSCKAAIKGGEINDEGALRRLADELMSRDDITYCPHGRPVAFIMKKSNIQHKFGRD